jgi:hypothetical protein
MSHITDTSVGLLLGTEAGAVATSDGVKIVNMCNDSQSKTMLLGISNAHPLFGSRSSMAGPRRYRSGFCTQRFFKVAQPTSCGTVRRRLDISAG